MKNVDCGVDHRRAKFTKFFKPVALVAVGLMIGGAVTVSAATSTNPVTLCVRNASIREAADDTCTDRETRIEVASQADVAALAAQLDVLADRVAAHETLLDQLEVLLPGELTVTPNADGVTINVEGHHLKPGSQVRTFQLLPGGGAINNDFTVGADGTVSTSVLPQCNPGAPAAVFFAQGTDQSGAASLQSNSILVC